MFGFFKRKAVDKPMQQEQKPDPLAQWKEAKAFPTNSSTAVKVPISYVNSADHINVPMGPSNVRSSRIMYRAEYSDLVNAAADFMLIKFDGSSIETFYNGPDEAKLVCKELRLLKRMAGVKKREINDAYKARAEIYRHKVGNRSSLAFLTGTGKYGTYIRAGVRMYRAVQRGQMADLKLEKERAIAPWDNLIQYIESEIFRVERDKIRMETP